MPFIRDQLESFEMERRALLAQNEVAEGEAKKLAVQNGRLLGHQVTFKNLMTFTVMLFKTTHIWKSLTRFLMKIKKIFLKILLFLNALFPPEPLSEDSTCGENQAGEYAAED